MPIFCTHITDYKMKMQQLPKALLVPLYYVSTGLTDGQGVTYKQISQVNSVCLTILTCPIVSIVSEDDTGMERDGGNRSRRRRVQATNTVTRFGRNCTYWDWLDVGIATDKKFMDRYADQYSKVQAMFAEAAESYSGRRVLSAFT